MSYSVNVITSSSPYKVDVNTSSTPYQVNIKVGAEVDSKKYAEEAAISASEALASEQGALESETNAAASELSASSDAQTATEQAIIATEKAVESSASASEALISEQNATISETNAGISASNASDSELAAQTAATQAIAAKDEIVDKIDFTGLVEGDILRHNGTELVKISEVDFLKSKVPFEKSLLATDTIVKGVSFWDTFNRPSSEVMISDCGIPYESFNGGAATINSNGFITINGIIRFSTAQVLRTPNSATVANGIWVKILSGANLLETKLFFFISDTEYYEVSFTVGRYFRVRSYINGVETLMSEQDIGSNNWSPEGLDFYFKQLRTVCVRSSNNVLNLVSNSFLIGNHIISHIGISGTMNSIKITRLTY